MSGIDDLEFPVWDRPLPEPPRMTPEQYDQFLYDTLFPGKRTAGNLYEPVPAEFILVKEDVPSEGRIDER
jgi:hypothetical protein